MGWLLNLLLHIWQSFLALHPWGYVTTAGVLLLAFFKRKAISGALSASWKRLNSWFWEKMRTNLQIQSQSLQKGQSHFRTYRGTFQDYSYQSLPFPCHILEMSNDGVLETVPVSQTHLLQSIKRGTFIEVDTEATVGLSSELVKRVRKPKTT
jgi:hypothetical protein